MPVDPKHGQAIPSGRNLARVLSAFMRQIGNSALRQLSREQRVSFAQFITPMIEQITPLIRMQFQRGRLESSRRLARMVAAREAAKRSARKRAGTIAAILTKAPNPITITTPTLPASAEIAFDVFLPQVELAIQRQVYQFVESTLATAWTDAQGAYRSVRRELQEGLSDGEAQRSLFQRINRIFNDPARAARIAVTESSRAMHAGQLLAAQESGVVAGLRWLASSDACERCMELDGEEVKLGTPFYVDPKGGPYAVVTHAPLHPHCMCTTEEILL